MIREASTLTLSQSQWVIRCERICAEGTCAPISLTMTAIRRPWLLRRMCWSKVVFPLPYFITLDASFHGMI